MSSWASRFAPSDDTHPKVSVPLLSCCHWIQHHNYNYSLKSNQEIADNIFRLTTKQLTDNILWCTGLTQVGCGRQSVSSRGRWIEVPLSEWMHAIPCLVGIYSFAMFLNSCLLRQNMQFCNQKKSDSKLVCHFRYVFIGKWGQIIHLPQ